MGCNDGGIGMRFDLDKAIHEMMKYNPNYTTIQIICKNDLENEIKNNPNVVRKGRWLYYKYNDKLIFIRVLKYKEPSGYKVFHAKRIAVAKPEEYKIPIKKEIYGGWFTFDPVGIKKS